ncbi:surface antigen [Holospora elegans E1]|uniref:Surface antigen n=1 Tax=Holospora elegans E1 TaxID=1427503 RepID=A0A023E093_9PROT|nr:glycine zipper domain-containing protein [Holospora elegans]GAJ46855.1 surface antigen [Holospora elegans E1]
MRFFNFLLISLLLSGCAPRIGSRDYALSGVGETCTTLPGKIIAKRTVNVSGSSTTEDDNKPGVGALVGALAGGLGGSAIGQGTGSLFAAAGGALAGGAIGHYAARALTDQDGVEYQIQLDTGAFLTVVQGPSPALCVGQKVFVVQSQKDRSRVIPR